jgi:maleate isomerase
VTTATMSRRRIGLVVPSSNVTIETELPEVLGAYRDFRCTFHSSRMRMSSVTPEGLAAMDAQRERCVDELIDTDCEVLVYGCLIAIAAQGAGKHRQVEQAIVQQLAVRNHPMHVVTSAGALIDGIRSLGAKRVAVVMPYTRRLAEHFVEYLTADGIDVVDWTTLDEPDNRLVARIQGSRVVEAALKLDVRRADAVVASACVQMPSLSVLEPLREMLQLPVLSTLTATASAVARCLDASSAACTESQGDAP